MFKLALLVGLAGLLAACSIPYNPAPRASATDASNTAIMGGMRSAGEGPALSPYYGGAGF